MIDNLSGILRKITSTVTVETKKRRLLWAACATWLGVLVVFTVKNILSDDPLDLFSLKVNIVNALVICAIFYFDIKGKSELARYLISICLTISISVSALFLFPGENIELFLLIIGPFCVFFIRNIIGQLFFFSVAFLVFMFTPEITGIRTFIHDIFHLKLVFIIVFFIVRDVDWVNRKTEKQLNEQKEELDELNNFKNKFFINISHELRTPLTLIDGLASQLNKDADKSPLYTKKILEQSGKMKQIVDDILDLSKVRSQKLSLTFREVEINKMLSKLHRSFLDSFEEKDLVFDLHLSPNLCYAQVDLIYFERALNNILLNSLKFTDSGRVDVFLTSEKEQLKISVKDTGIGIPKEDITKVFGEFYQIDNDINKASGSGVGLSFSQSIIELHKGKIVIVSELGQGTMFSILIPGVSGEFSFQQKPSDSIEKKTAVKQSVSTEDRVLVVDDNKEMRSYIVSLLHDYDVLEAKDGLDALEVLRTEQVNFVITDYMMPRMNGYEFIKELKKNKYDSPVLMLTARADIEAKMEVLRLGIDDYMTKPFNREELLIRIENGLRNSKERFNYKEVEEENGEIKDQEVDGLISDLEGFIKGSCHLNKFGLEDIKDQFALSTSSLYRKVKSETGMSPSEMIKEIRLQKARSLVEAREVNSLKSLSLSVGMKNSTYFSKQYEARFGTVLTFD